ncbi:hypothetical protein DFH06DRAFT_1298391 [Mycena polygramma]|nr:hypothetical protein DFH06DRAFT_1298391 [Mycena polygramma]
MAGEVLAGSLFRALASFKQIHTRKLNGWSLTSMDSTFGTRTRLVVLAMEFELCHKVTICTCKALDVKKSIRHTCPSRTGNSASKYLALREEHWEHGRCKDQTCVMFSLNALPLCQIALEQNNSVSKGPSAKERNVYTQIALLWGTLLYFEFNAKGPPNAAR